MIELLRSALGDIGPGDLWPGFAPSSFPYAVWDGTKTWLLSHPSPPREFEADPDRPGVLCFPGLHPAVRGNSVVEIGGIPTATILLKGDRSLREQVALLVHELFHAFQVTHHPDWRANEVELLTYPAEDEGGLHLRRLEAVALQRALDAPTPSGARLWAGVLVGIRGKRLGALPEGARDYELGIELVEGTAYYVEAVAAGRDIAPLRALDGLRPGEVRAVFCIMGEGLAFLLDRVAPGWKGDLERGAFARPGDVLNAAVRPALISRLGRPVFRDARNWARLRRAEILAAREELLSEFLTRPGWTLDLETEPPLWPAGFDPMNIVRLSGNSVLHRRWLKLAGEGGEMECLGRACLTFPAGDHPLFRGVRRAVVTGIGGQPEVEERGGRVVVRAEGLRLYLVGAEVELTGRTIRVRRRAPPGRDAPKGLD